MTDRDVIDEVEAKVAKMVDKKYFTPERKTKTSKTVYGVSVGDRQTLYYLLPLLLPHMGERRAARIQGAIDAIAQWMEWVEKGGRSEMSRRGYNSGLGKIFNEQNVQLQSLAKEEWVKEYLPDELGEIQD